MKVRCIGIRKYDLLNYLNHNWKGFDTKDYELLIAVYFCDFFKKQFGGEHMIGIPVKFNKTSDIGTKYSTENIKNTLQKYTEEDTSVDLFIIARKDLKEIPPVGRGKGQAFQLKRIRTNKKEDITESILIFLKEYIPKKYGDTQATLILVIGESGDDGELHPRLINLKRIKEEFNPKKYPFHSVMFTIKIYGKEMLIGELWPNFGISKVPFKNYRFLRK